MATNYTEYDIPASWTPNDVVVWINEQLALTDVKSVEFFISSGKLCARVHEK